MAVTGTPALPYQPAAVDEQCIGCDDGSRAVVALYYGEPYCAGCACADGCEHFHPGEPCPVADEG
jgi:hypothetical protein